LIQGQPCFSFSTGLLFVKKKKCKERFTKETIIEGVRLYRQFPEFLEVYHGASERDFRAGYSEDENPVQVIDAFVDLISPH
jgi:hypothetical protein